jgi:hypothetical protein
MIDFKKLMYNRNLFKHSDNHYVFSYKLGTNYKTYITIIDNKATSLSVSSYPIDEIILMEINKAEDKVQFIIDNLKPKKHFKE